MKSAIVYFSSRVFTALCNLLAISLYTRIVTPEDYGLFAFVITFNLALFAVLFQWISAGILRFLPSEDRWDSPTMGAALAGFGGTALLALPLMVLLGFWPGLDLDFSYLVLLSLLLFATAGFEVSLAVIQSRQVPVSYAILAVARTFGAVLFGCVFALLGFGAFGMITGTLIGHALPVLWLLWRFRRNLWGLNVDKKILKSLWTFGFPLALIGLSTSIIGLTDRAMIAWLAGLDEVGLYAAPFELSQRTLAILMMSAFLAYSPIIFRAYEKDEDEFYRSQLLSQVELMLFTSLTAMVILMAAAPLVSRIFFGEAFREDATLLIPIIALSATISGFQSYYLSYGFTLTKKMLANASTVACGALVNIGLNIIFIPIWGAFGAAVATLTGNLMIMVLSLILMRRWLTLPFPWRDFFKMLAVSACLYPFIFMAGRLEGLLTAMVLTGLACTAYFGLLALFNVCQLRAKIRSLFKKKLI